MMKKTKKWMTLGSLAAVLALGACSSSNPTTSAENQTVGEQLNYTITGTDPGAGLMRLSAQAMEDYDLSEWKLSESSAAAMTAALDKAYKKEDPIVITA